MYSITTDNIIELENQLNPIINKVMDCTYITEWEYSVMMEMIADLEYALNDIISAFNHPEPHPNNDDLVLINLEDDDIVAFLHLSKAYKTIEQRQMALVKEFNLLMFDEPYDE